MTWLAETMMLSHGWRRFLLLAVAGAVAALSAAPLFFLPALFVAMPLLVWALDGAEMRRGWRRLVGPPFSIGFAFGLGYFVGSLHWLGAAFLQQGGFYVALMPLAILALAAVLAVFWGVGSALAHLFWSTGPLRIVSLVSFLGLAEFARGHLFSGFPFNLLGYALTANDEMLQLASVIGTYGLTLLAALVAASPALIWPADQRPLTRRLTPLFLAVGAIAAQVGFGNYRLASTVLTPRTDISLRLVQPMIRDHADWTLADPATTLGRLIALTENGVATQTEADGAPRAAGPATPESNAGLAGITHVVWPESVFPFFLTQYPEALGRIARMLPPSVLLLTGAPREPIGPDGDPIPDNPGYNSILAIDANGEIVASYDKSHLVPFGEYLPLQDLFRSFGINQFVPGTNGWAAGEGRRLLTVPGTPPFLALVCYEAVFPGDIGDVGQAQFILNVTNDAWFDGSIGPSQHAHHARIRAVETGLPMLRAANTGTTLAVDPLGRVTARLPEGSIGTLDVVPPQRLPDTIFTRFGSYIFWGGIGFGLVVAVLSSRRRHRSG